MLQVMGDDVLGNFFDSLLIMEEVDLPRGPFDQFMPLVLFELIGYFIEGFVDGIRINVIFNKSGLKMEG